MKELGMPEGLGRLKEGEQTVELRFVNSEGQTEVWILKGENVGPNRICGLTGAVVWRAYLDDGMDTRLGNQRASIQRLLDHLEFHHNKLGPVDLIGCGYEGKDHA